VAVLKNAHLTKSRFGSVFTCDFRLCSFSLEGSRRRLIQTSASIPPCVFSIQLNKQLSSMLVTAWQGVL